MEEADAAAHQRMNGHQIPQFKHNGAFSMHLVNGLRGRQINLSSDYKAFNKWQRKPGD